MSWPAPLRAKKVEHLQIAASAVGAVARWVDRSPLEEVQLGGGEQRGGDQLGALQRKVPAIENRAGLIDLAKDTWAHRL
eukprot:943535-Pyramimonas_sp.AAC.1